VTGRARLALKLAAAAFNAVDAAFDAIDAAIENKPDAAAMLARAARDYTAAPRLQPAQPVAQRRGVRILPALRGQRTRRLHHDHGIVGAHVHQRPQGAA
jgi:hypothetical protein